MRIVLDTNIIVSGLISVSAPPSQLLDLWADGAFRLVTSDAQINELCRVVQYDRLRDRVRGNRLAAFLANVPNVATVLHELPVVRLSTDPDDNTILATGIAGAADVIVTGDKRHLLSLGQAEGIPIISARRACELLAPPPPPADV